MCAAVALPFANLAQRYAAPYPPGEHMPSGQLASPFAAPPASLGRVATWSVDIFVGATRQSARVRRANRDDVLPLYEELVGEAVTSYNAVWYQTDGGYVHSAWVQPVENSLNPVDPAQNNFWGEVTVPFSDARQAPNPAIRRFTRVYYTSVYRVIAIVTGQDDQPWYRLQDGITWSPGPYVPAAHIRRIDPSELTPLSPGASKRVEVDLAAQIITAYENDVPVLTSRVASGYGTNRTPSGTHHVPVEVPCLAHDRRSRQRLLRSARCALPDLFHSAGGSDPWRVLAQRLRTPAQSWLPQRASAGGPLVLALD